MSSRISDQGRALRLRGHLDRALTERSESIERLASGRRINRSSDDAAGLSVVSSLKSDARIFTRAIQNLNDGISLIAVAEGAVRSLSEISTRQVELAEQSANGVYGSSQRRALDQEAQSLKAEYDRILASTRFNGVRLFGDLTEGLRIQAGYGVDGSISGSFGDRLCRAVGTGAFQASVSYYAGGGNVDVLAEDLNRDGHVDLVTANWSVGTIGVLEGNGDGTFRSPRTYYATGTANSLHSIDLGDANGDSILDLLTTSAATSSVGLLLGNADGSFKARTTYTSTGNPRDAIFADINGDRRLDIVSAWHGTQAIRVQIGLGNGSFGPMSSLSTGNYPEWITSTDIDQDGREDLVVSQGGSSRISILRSNGDGTFTHTTHLSTGGNPEAHVYRDFDGDGVFDIASADEASDQVSLFMGNSDGSFSARQVLPTGDGPWAIASDDYNGDGIDDIVTADHNSLTLSIFLGNGDGSFRARSTQNTVYNAETISSKDLNADGAPDLALTQLYGGGQGVSVFLSETRREWTSRPFSLLTMASSLEALGMHQRDLAAQGEELGRIGAFRSRLETAARNLEVSRENSQAAASRIEDVDVAFETARMVQASIRTQQVSSIFASANVASEMVQNLLL